MVYDAPGVRLPYAYTFVFKQYRPNVRASLDVSVLESMPAYLAALPTIEGSELLERAAWPCRLVEDAGAVVGFVMPTIPSEFYINIHKAKGLSRTVGEFQHLLNSPSFLARRQIPITDQHRYQLLAETAHALSIFHRHSIAVGDLSPKNLLFSLHPHTRVYFIDCDAMRLQGRSVTKQVETPEWEVRAVNPNEELATPKSDSYKLGLLALRLLAGDQQTRNPTNLPRAVPAPIRQLIKRSLSPNPTRRPNHTEWDKPLRTAAAHASTKPPKRPAPTTQKPTTSPTPRPQPIPRHQWPPPTHAPPLPHPTPPPTPQPTTPPHPTKKQTIYPRVKRQLLLNTLGLLGPILVATAQFIGNALIGLIAGLAWLAILFGVSMCTSMLAWNLICLRSRRCTSVEEFESGWYYGITGLIALIISYYVLDPIVADVPYQFAYLVLHIGFMICVSLISIIASPLALRR